MKRSIQAVFLSILLSAGGAWAHPNHDDDPMSPKRAATPRASYAVSGATTDGVVRVTINREGAKDPTANAATK